jgi:hypothetical protein
LNFVEAPKGASSIFDRIGSLSRTRATASAVLSASSAALRASGPEVPLPLRIASASAPERSPSCDFRRLKASSTFLRPGRPLAAERIAERSLSSSPVA